MNPKLKYVFCNSNPATGGTTEIPVYAIDEKGQLLHGTVHAQSLNNWLAREATFTPVAIGGTGNETETRRTSLAG